MALQVETQNTPDNDSVTTHSNTCNDANCTCHEPEFPHAKLATLDEKISSPRWVVPVLPDQELECLMQAAINLCRTGNDCETILFSSFKLKYLYKQIQST
jgi:ubiquitin carboxyl-terminal hydrolase 9/24